jgi:hypothetical protein
MSVVRRAILAVLIGGSSCAATVILGLPGGSPAADAQVIIPPPPCIFTGVGFSNVVTGSCNGVSGTWSWDPTNGICTFYPASGVPKMQQVNRPCNFGLPVVPPILTPVVNPWPSGDGRNHWGNIPRSNPGQTTTIIVPAGGGTATVIVGTLPTQTVGASPVQSPLSTSSLLGQQ